MSPFWPDDLPVAVRTENNVPQAFVWHYEDQPNQDLGTWQSKVWQERIEHVLCDEETRLAYD